MVPLGESRKDSERRGVLRWDTLRVGERVGEEFLLFLRLSMELCEPCREPAWEEFRWEEDRWRVNPGWAVGIRNSEDCRNVRAAS